MPKNYKKEPLKNAERNKSIPFHLNLIGLMVSFFLVFFFGQKCGELHLGKRRFDKGKS